MIHEFKQHPLTADEFQPGYFTFKPMLALDQLQTPLFQVTCFFPFECGVTIMVRDGDLMHLLNPACLPEILGGGHGVCFPPLDTFGSHLSTSSMQ